MDAAHLAGRESVIFDFLVRSDGIFREARL